jgi:phage terminase large subunit-like protein
MDVEINIDGGHEGLPSRDQPVVRLPKRTAFGRKRAKDVIRFIEALRIPSGHGAGQNFKLAKWQRAFIRDIYEPHYRDDRRAVRRAILSVSRKNGKTALIAAIVLAHLIGPEREPRGEIYSAANDRDQASIVFKFVKQLIEQDPRLLNAVQLVPSTKTIVAPGTGSVYRAISAEAGTKHGYLPSVVIYDELAQAKSRELYDVLDTSFGACDEPLFICISTQSNDPEHILSRLIDDGISGADPSIICHLYAADEDCDLEDEEQWKKANPALDDFRDREDLAAAIRKCRRLPAEEPKVRNLFLNQRVAPVAALIAPQCWKDCIGDADFHDGEDVYLGLDLSGSLDLTALVMVSAAEPARVAPFFWKPADTLELHSNRDFGTGNHRYWAWQQNGHLLTSPGSSVDPEVVAKKVGELQARYNVRGIAYDRWRIDMLLREFDDIGLACYREKGTPDGPVFTWATSQRDIGLRCVPWGQGYREMAPAVQALEHAIANKQIVHGNHPVMNWNLANAVATIDPAGNKKLDKGKARFRIDGAVALAMAMGLRARDRENAKPIDVEALIG